MSGEVVTKRKECLTCIHFMQEQRPIGTCEVTKQYKLAWHGCTSNYVCADTPDKTSSSRSVLS